MADFYLRYYVGHKGKFGHEFLEFEFRPDGKLRYANNSNYKNDTMIRKEAFVSKSVMDELKRIIEDSEILKEDDSLWPQPDRVGRQELEIVMDGLHIAFTTSKIGSLVDVNQCKGLKDPSQTTCTSYGNYSSPPPACQMRNRKEISSGVKRWVIYTVVGVGLSFVSLFLLALQLQFRCFR